MMMRLFGASVVMAALASAACSASTDAPGASADAVSAPASNAQSATSSSSATPAAGGSASAAGTPLVDTLDANRARLLASYVDFLQTNATTPQSNGLSAATATSSCTAWSGLAPSAQLVFITLTARLQGSTLGTDGSSMLSHVTKIYRIAGGENATATDPGSCGGGEFNRMIMSMDATLHEVLVAANDHQGAPQNGKLDISDQTKDFWRNSHDLGGPHAPFDLSDETNNGAPRGQTQFFADPTTAVANAALGRQDLETLVDPLALEMDEDYDCPHHSNPACSYTFYGPLCIPESSTLGLDLYTKNYGDPDVSWTPTCP